VADTEEPRGEAAEKDFEEELTDITRGDVARIAVMRASLKQFANGLAGPVLKEMADEVLAGRLDLRTAATSGAYSQTLFESYGKFWSKLERIPEAERERLAQSGAAMLAKMRGKLTEDRE
jgi:hypothetical protein